MKKFKKIIASVLSAVMMMAMSVTAFAAEAPTAVVDGKASIKITNFSEREDSVVSLYQIASVMSDNTVKVADWAKDLYVPGDDEFDATELTAALKAANPQVKATATSTKGSDVVFENLDGGAYMILATGTTVKYNSMVAVTYEIKDGVYYTKTKTVDIKAKGSSNSMEKTEDDGLVRIGQNVTFTLTSTVPYMANKKNVEYKIYDRETNLSAPIADSVVVTVGGETVTGFSFDEGVVKGDYTLYTMDLTNLVKPEMKDQYAGKTVVITYKATFVGGDCFINKTYDSTFEFDNNGEPINPPTVKGWPGSFALTKYDEKGEKILKGAQFELTKEGVDGALNFIADENQVGVYYYSETAISGKTVTTLEATEGFIYVKGLDEGNYHFTETVAPEGYSINPAGLDFTIDNISEQLTNRDDELTEAEYKAINKYDCIRDTKLTSLPFTGGMGTTIFTVFGVAIMAIAAALYFSMKRKAA
ncbi:LPXTG-motif cell wall anchor domain-containing protein/fimbrial isopeptide formation D2 domain-containing protein [Pseudobutyrivibrio sp. YE44]|uniref:SpaA isopeptide-forming pilin-related protein n=1 Tax=Pseudobutyrivibrio sp. YE44 TaxID=1520802 RepID=UPI000882BD11|nr:SpaA isopeptide-forming pilin-related protein [Pseudobutyrivibrio sp. YE44]SDB34847.1 LPXTG-motif cell wall anchor domain-containing protein/fimbrial isopeptide formation D2 domain-containing protein [Pseudobutyrivibrio sp. YE44]